MNEPKDGNMAQVPMLPAMDANLFGVSATKTEVKITFGQQWVQGGDIAWFAAVKMTHSDLRWLADLAEKLIQEKEASGSAG